MTQKKKEKLKRLTATQNILDIHETSISYNFSMLKFIY